MRENGDGQERIVYVRTGKRTGSRGTYIVWWVWNLDFKVRLRFQRRLFLGYEKLNKIYL